MQPQIEQIERIAAALNVYVSAISGFNSSPIRFETVGDLMGLLIAWHKAGILTIEGKRDAGHYIEMESASPVPNPLLGSYLAVKTADKGKEKTVRWDSFSLDLIGYTALHDLLNWERFYYIFIRTIIFLRHIGSTRWDRSPIYPYSGNTPQGDHLFTIPNGIQRMVDHFRVPLIQPMARQPDKCIS